MEILRNLWRRKLRSTLTITGIVMGILALTTMGGLAEHFNALLDGGVTYFGSNIQVGDDKSRDFGGGLLPLSTLDQVKQVDGVAAASPTIGAAARPGEVRTVNFNLPDTVVN